LWGVRGGEVGVAWVGCWWPIDSMESSHRMRVDVAADVVVRLEGKIMYVRGSESIRVLDR